MRSVGGIRTSGLFWLAAAVLLCLSVLAINRVPLYYFDSGHYKIQGDSILARLFSDRPEAGAADTGETAADIVDKEVNINRSPIYAILVALAWIPGKPYAIALFNLLSVLIASAFTARIAVRSASAPGVPSTLATAPIALAALTSLPFYVAYVMPDIFAPIAILVMATTVAYGRSMTRAELMFALALLAFCVIVHRSHLLIVGLAAPLALIAVLFTSRRHWWIAAALIAAAAAAGIAEIKAYSAVAENASGKQASISPFLTARLIHDGPGYTYLLEHCPDPEIPTCILAEALTWSDDPYRLTASHILFDRSERLGSYARLPADDQIRVARDQRRFLMSVFAEQPFAVIGAVLKNTVSQTFRVSVIMTVPDGYVIGNLKEAVDPALDPGRFSQHFDWIPKIDKVHYTIYGISLAIVVGVLLTPGLASRETRVFAGFVIVGILLNAFVCGAVSQPAERYGGRVIWLLPYLATFVCILAFRRRSAGVDTGFARPEESLR